MPVAVVPASRDAASPPADLVGTVVRLCRALRERGIAATPSESIDGARALGLVDLGDADEVRLALRGVLVHRREDFDAFEEAFREVWAVERGLPSPMPLPGPRRDLVKPPAPAPSRQPSVSLQNWMKPSDGDRGDPVMVRTASDNESLAARDFAHLGAEDDEAFQALARRIARRLSLRRSRRWKASRRGRRIDLRRTVRASLRTGGDPIALERRTRKIRRTSLVALCDVSGSMELYARFLLQFLHALQNTFARVETFAFATRLSRLTPLLRGVRYRDSLRDLGREVQDFSGGTRIGASIRDFVARYPSLVDRRTIVVILSDGWDVGDPAVLSEAMRTLHRRAGRVIWLNPLMGAADFTPDTRGMQAALPYVDLLAPGHNLEALQRLVRHLAL
ncbi:MAG TPA: VWA domain-containing protein [Gemmatimonadaceae bacterium]|nr:VWA domain-containing protein [Gemmatimonadaceae bacterium]